MAKTPECEIGPRQAVRPNVSEGWPVFVLRTSMGGCFCTACPPKPRRQRWRRRRDSNPRYAFGAYNGLANRRLQPLGHVSASENIYISAGWRSNRWRANSGEDGERVAMLMAQLVAHRDARPPPVRAVRGRVQVDAPAGTACRIKAAAGSRPDQNHSADESTCLWQTVRVSPASRVCRARLSSSSRPAALHRTDGDVSGVWSAASRSDRRCCAETALRSWPTRCREGQKKRTGVRRVSNRPPVDPRAKACSSAKTHDGIRGLWGQSRRRRPRQPWLACRRRAPLHLRAAGIR